MFDIIEAVENANPNRNVVNIDRRTLKLCEESGELAQAVLAVTSKHNRKKKTWEDVLEEACDVIILGLDIALTTYS